MGGWRVCAQVVCRVFAVCAHSHHAPSLHLKQEAPYRQHSVQRRRLRPKKRRSYAAGEIVQRHTQAAREADRRQLASHASAYFTRPVIV